MIPTELLEAPKVLFRFGAIPITETIVNSWIAMGFIFVISLLAVRNLRRIPKGTQALVEVFYEAFENLVEMIMGTDAGKYLAFAGCILIYIFTSNVMGMFGLRPPTSDLNITVAMALLAFFAVHIGGARKKGLGYLKDFIQPNIVFTPLNVIGELARPVSLSFRLFGNILGGTIIVGMVYNAVPFLIPVPLHLYFDVFVGLIQSFIFMMLTIVFISLARA